MRESALPIAAMKILSATLVAFALLGSFACGDDDDGSSADAGPGSERGGRGGRGGSAGRTAGSGGTGGGASIVPLEDNSAGKTCEENADCGGSGMCLTELAGMFGMGTIKAPGGYCSGECMTSQDCGEGGSCSGAVPGILRGQCLQACSDTSECRQGYRCVNLAGQMPSGDAGTMGAGALLGGTTCQPLPDTDKLADGVVGSACSEDTDCGDGRCIKTSAATTYPGGYCSGACLSDADCGAGGSCTPGFLGAAGTCYLKCANDGDCTRQGYRCRTSGDRMQCVPGAAPLPDNTTGKACASDADCGGAAMSCAPRLGQRQYTAPGGYCTQRCVNSTDCGAGGVCVGGSSGSGLPFGTTAPTGTCYKSCADASGCREGYTCGPAGRTGTAATQNICSVTPPPPPAEDAGI